MRFSERIGERQPKSKMQVDSMDDDLRNGLWNAVYFLTFKSLPTGWSKGSISVSNWQYFFTAVWIQFYKKPIDEILYNKGHLEGVFKKWFFEADYLDVYDFIDFIAKLDRPFEADEFKRVCNQVLENELAPYRFVGNDLSPITNETEIAEIETAMKEAGTRRLRGVQAHLESALDKLSDRKRPDYRNSIKESISAVESLCAVISDDQRLPWEKR